MQQDQDQEHQEEQGNGEAEQQQQEQQQEEEEEQEEGAVEDAVMEDAGEVVVEGDGNGDAEEGQGESEGVDPIQEEVSYPDGIDENKRKLNEKLDVLNKKKHGLVQMLKQILDAEEEIRRRSMQASLRAAMPQPSENATDGSSVSRLAPRMTVDVNFGDVAGDSDAGSNQGTPGRPLHHFHSISPSTASFARSPFGSLQGHTPRSPTTFSTASPSRFATNIHQGQPPALYSASLPGSARAPDLLDNVLGKCIITRFEVSIHCTVPQVFVSWLALKSRLVKLSYVAVTKTSKAGDYRKLQEKGLAE
ncbi:unnamed protein product [Miscanthus lutarioriparius]|uniref:Uncharacterized protein n=1 Tax=Miscanthus lutarioriparius TaxID=422564 RepID=A0A811SMK8_9POAL|nr:unnamed protein product [Miscanthus lutarioriparius]